MVKQQRRTEDSVRQGMGLAMIRFHSVHGDINAVAEMMNSLNSPGAQAAFADTWLRKAAYTLTTCWQIVYELCRVIIEEEIHLHPEWLQGQSFSSFKEYFSSRLNTSLDTLVDLEETYHLFQKYKPDVIAKLALLTEEEDGNKNIELENLKSCSKTEIQQQREDKKSRDNEILKFRDQFIEELCRIARDEIEKNHQLMIVKMSDHEELKAILPQMNSIKHWEELEKAVDKEWLLSTSEVKQLIGVKPKNSLYVRGSFKFTKYGKIGNQSSWLVEKLSIEKSIDSDSPSSPQTAKKTSDTIHPPTTPES